MNALKASAVHLELSTEQKGVSEFSLGTSESEADERYLFYFRNKYQNHGNYIFVRLDGCAYLELNGYFLHRH